MPFGVRLVCHLRQQDQLQRPSGVTNAFRREAGLSQSLQNKNQNRHRVTNAFRREAGLSQFTMGHGINAKRDLSPMPFGVRLVCHHYPCPGKSVRHT